MLIELLLHCALAATALVWPGHPGSLRQAPASLVASLPAPSEAVLSPAPLQGPSDPWKRERWSFPHWPRDEVLVQGYLGAAVLDEARRSGGTGPSVDGSSASLGEFPVVGGGGQWKLGGRAVDWGFEALLAFGGRANATGFASGAGGGTLAVDVDLLVFDLFGGLFASRFVGERMRVWAGAGPLMRWADYEQNVAGASEGGWGFGLGWYGRGGVELATGDLLVGLGARWSDATVSLGGGLGDLEVVGAELLFTVSRSL